MTDSSVITSRHIIVATCQLDVCTSCEDALQNNALGTSAGVRGHGAAGRARGTAPTARSQTPPFHIGMGEAAEAAGDGGTVAGDGGAGDARALRRGRRAAWPPTQHTAARRRVRSGRASAITSPLSASRADEEQLPAAAEQVRERRAGVGGRGRGRRGRGVRAARGAGQEGGAAAEGDAVVGAHGRAAGAGVPGRRAAAALRHGPAPRRALPAPRRVTPRAPPLPYHAYIPLSGRSDRRRARASRSIIDLVFIYWDAWVATGSDRRAPRRPRHVKRSLRLK